MGAFIHVVNARAAIEADFSGGIHGTNICELRGSMTGVAFAA